MSDHAHVETIIGLARKRLVSHARGSWLRDGAGHFLFAAPHPSRVIVNGAWLTTDIALDDVWHEAVSRSFARLGHDFSLYVPDGFTHAETSLHGSNFVRRISFPTMRLAGRPPGLSRDDRTTLKPVQTPADLAAFIALCAQCFEFSPATAGLCRALLADWTPQPDQQAFLLRAGETVAAVAMVLIVEGHAVIDWVAAHSDFRRRGYGALVTEAAIHAGFDLGANAAVLHASAAGAGLYRALGFMEIGAMALYSPKTTQ